MFIEIHAYEMPGHLNIVVVVFVTSTVTTLSVLSLVVGRCVGRLTVPSDGVTHETVVLVVLPELKRIDEGTGYEPFQEPTRDERLPP